MPATGYPAKSAKPSWTGELVFDTNGTSDSPSTTWTGSLARYVTSITYAATGKQTIVFNSEFTLFGTPVWTFAARAEAVGSGFSVIQIGSYNATTRTLVLNTTNGSTSGVAVAAGSSPGLQSVIVRCHAPASTGA